ncbi:Crp/Fnr family transcriptional regulator [uncultured Helcococcus sp.]|uniref:Crp/Fnr family transcriptional regulator n=1 Tax=uncultured Helcococcus sp. TaxID=1072508 RepID=UPI00262627AC|nr:Crp/Fnr family transcriptional regulator [uncultured Helcococcus sp.]
MDKYQDNKKFDYKDIPLLSLLSEEEYFSIKNNIFIQEYSKGEVIFRTHDPASKMFVVLAGEIKISKIMSDGKEQILYIYEPGNFVGAHNILSGDMYEYTAYALKKTLVLTISSSDVDKVLKHNQQFLLMVAQQSFERIRKAEELIDRLSVISTDVKLAKLLKNLMSLYGKENEDGVMIEFNITQEELGSLSGISRETVSRKLNQFEEEGIIKIVSRGKILILNEAELDNILL